MEIANNLAPLVSQDTPVVHSQDSNGGASFIGPLPKYRKYNKRLILVGSPEYFAWLKSKREYAQAWRNENRDKCSKYYKNAWANNRAGRTASNRKYVAKNRAKVYAKAKEYHKKNRVHENRRRRDRYASDESYKAKRNESSKQYSLLNSESISLQRRTRWRENIEENRAKIRQYYWKNPAPYKARAKAREYQKRGAPIGQIKAIADWESAWKEKPEVRCYWCLGVFSPKDCETEHMHPMALGGIHCIENLCISCKSCNDYKSCKPLHRWNRLILNPLLQLGENII